MTEETNKNCAKSNENNETVKESSSLSSTNTLQVPRDIEDNESDGDDDGG